MLEALGLWIGKTTIYEAVQDVAERVPGMKRTILLIDKLSGEDAQTLKEWLAPIIETVHARVLVTDNADALKTAADENGVYQQVCKSHVGRNTEALIEQLQASLSNDFNPSLEQIGVSVQQALLDLLRLKELIHLRQPEARSELENM
jgi:hypothetical protein